MKIVVVTMNNTALFLGPSRIGLEGFGEPLSLYDCVARTNLYLESNNCRCDMIYLNKFSFNKYMESNNFDDIKNKTVLVKFDDHKELLQNKLPKTNVVSLQKEREQFTKQFGLEPYSGTSLIVYLSNTFKDVYVSGLDFYDSGFGKNAKYIKGYEAYNKSNTEEPVHNIKKDLRFLKELMQNKSNITLLGKTKKIYERLVEDVCN
jgi:hypothetical protein